MVLSQAIRTTCAWTTLGAALLLPAPAAAADTPRPGEVTLALKDYLDLVQTVAQRERERRDVDRRREPDVAEVAVQRTNVVVAGELATVEQVFEVVVQGVPRAPVVLPLAALASETRVERLDGPRAAGAAPNSSASASLDGVDGAAGGARLVVTSPGRYRVTVRGTTPLPLIGGARALPLAAVLAPVAEASVDLPADADWNCAGAVPVEESSAGARRHVRLALPRGANPTFEMRRKGDTAQAEELLAQSVTLTLLQLLPDGPRRFDIVLYDVARGGLATMVVDLPQGVVPDSVISDEGETLPTVEGRHLRVERRQQLRGTGYLLVVSTPAAGAADRPVERLPIGELEPAVATRARYVVLASAVAAEAHPLPAASWSRVDLDDLPPTLRSAVGGLDLLAAWRQTQPPVAGGVEAVTELAIAAPAPAARIETLVRRRETTTLLTPDHTLLFRDRFTLAQAGDSLRVTLAPGAMLWSVQAGGAPIAPIQQGSEVVVPLGLLGRDGGDADVEIVSVINQAIPSGRSRLELSAPRVLAPVLEHEWRLLLPEDARYRFASGDLRPAAPGSQPAVVWALEGSAAGSTLTPEELAKVPSAVDPWKTLQARPGAATDRINVGGNEAAQVPNGQGVVQVRVTDDRGEVLPGVTVMFSPAAGAPLMAVSDAQGDVVLALAPSFYTLHAELQGFSTVEWPNVQVAAGRRTRLEVQLSASVEDVITVTAESPMLDERATGPTTSLSNAPSSEGYRFGGSKKEKKADKDREGERAAAAFKQQAQALRQGLVGGVQPLNVSIPESGKVLLLAGVLPPELVSVAIDVKGKK